MSKSKPLTADDVRRAIGKVFQGQLSDSLVDQVVESLGLTPVSFMEELQVLDDALQPGTNRIDAIRKRRDAISNRNATYDELNAASLQFWDDIDWLLAELDASKENADHLRKSCEMLSESVVHWMDEAGKQQIAAAEARAEVERLRAEVERLRSLNERLEIGFKRQARFAELLRAEVRPHKGEKIRRRVFDEVPLQQLTDTNQELGLYEEADNPLVKYGRELSEGGLLDEFERQTKETDT